MRCSSGLPHRALGWSATLTLVSVLLAGCEHALIAKGDAVGGGTVTDVGAGTQVCSGDDGIPTDVFNLFRLQGQSSPALYGCDNDDAQLADCEDGDGWDVVLD